jgi:hypothetical protein
VVAKLILTFSSLGPESKPQWEGIIEGEWEREREREGEVSLEENSTSMHLFPPA